MKQRIDYKVAVIANKIHSTGVPSYPSYLSTLIKDYEPGRSLRSSDRLFLRPPRAKLVCSRRAFSIIAPMVWNSLSLTIDLVRHLQIERRRITMSGTLKTIKPEQFESKSGM